MCAAVVLAACADEPMAPSDVRVEASSNQDGRPFYYHRGEPVYLNEDPNRIVVATGSTAAAAEQRARELLAIGGHSVVASRALVQAPGHAVLTIDRAQGRSAVDVVASLRANPEVRFASPVFATDEGADVILLDRVLVAIKGGTSVAQVHALAAAAGTRVVRAPMPDSGRFHYTFEYLPNTDPLAAAAMLDLKLTRFGGHLNTVGRGGVHGTTRVSAGIQAADCRAAPGWA